MNTLLVTLYSDTHTHSGVYGDARALTTLRWGSHAYIICFNKITTTGYTGLLLSETV